jgi:DnaJ-class molecular chaperone
MQSSTLVANANQLHAANKIMRTWPKRERDEPTVVALTPTEAHFGTTKTVVARRRVTCRRCTTFVVQCAPCAACQGYGYVPLRGVQCGDCGGARIYVVVGPICVTVAPGARHGDLITCVSDGGYDICAVSLEINQV